MHSKESDFPVPFVRVQFPILVAYYLTISRAQGQTFKYAGLYLPKNVFAHGHMYVGLSRCGNPDGVHVFANQTEFSHLAHMLDSSTRYTKNVVYKELLSGRI
jgi:ATP-dependent exoDNAse (exonuclease V) alpha subunit